MSLITSHMFLFLLLVPLLLGAPPPPASSPPVTTPSHGLADSAPVLTLDAPLPGAYVNTHWPAYEGTAEKGATVIVSLNVEQVCSAKADAISGSWSCTSTRELADGGPYLVQVHFEDSGGGSSPLLDRLFNVDTVAPTPSISSPIAGVLVRTKTPLIAGTLEASASLTLAIDGKEYGPIDVGLDGTWSFTVPDPLSEGTHTLSASAIDRAGNTDSASLSWTQDTVPPPMPVVRDPQSGTQLFTRTPTFSGTADGGSTVHVFLDSTEAGVAQAGEDGSWSLVSSTRLDPGPHRVWAMVNDKAGNTSQSPEVAFSTALASPYGPGCAASPSATACWPWALVLLGLPLRRRLSR